MESIQPTNAPKVTEPEGFRGQSGSNPIMGGNLRPYLILIRTFLDYGLGFREPHVNLDKFGRVHHAIFVVNAARVQGTYLGIGYIPKTMFERNQGALACSTAARLENYDGVNWRLNMGVDINATFHADRDEKTIVACANIYVPHCRFITPNRSVHFETERISRGVSCVMLEYLMTRNAKLRVNPRDPSLRRFLCLVIREGKMKDGETDTVATVKCLLDAEAVINDLLNTGPCPFEACFDHNGLLLSSLSFLKLILDRGLSAKSGGVLTFLIRRRALEQEIQRVLNSGVDINAYSSKGSERDRPPGDRTTGNYTLIKETAMVGSLDIAKLLKERGADVNRPTKG
ncbi:hypothetical protein HD806DRAFT_549213 [Xylariaceae sp. AK1471]|nr:hypothetical protein HD806DRAFT_549213 [Xylariaceae sp. AK1471]